MSVVFSFSTAAEDQYLLLFTLFRIQGMEFAYIPPFR